MADVKIDWYRTPVDKALMKDLTRKSDLKGLRTAGTFLLVYAASVALGVWLFSQQLWVALVVQLYLHALFTNFIGMAAGVHELSHGTMFKTKWLNEVFYHVYCWLSWNSPVHFRASHGLHHQLTLFKDPDKEQKAGPVEVKFNPRNFLMWFTFDAEQAWSWLSRAVLHALGRADADYFFWNPLFEKGDKRRGQMIWWARFLVLSHAALAVAFVLSGLWVGLFLVNFAVFFASWYAKFCGAMQHTGLDESTPDWRLVCHTFTGGPLTRWLYWNMNYHVEHHMYAAVPCYNTPRLHRALAHDLPVPSRSLWAGVRLLFQIRKIQKTRPEYLYVPEFPPTAAPPRRS